VIYTQKNISQTQVCIVGSGLGGSSLAIKLAEKGIDFILVEAGGLKGESDNVSLENIGSEFGLRTTRSIQLGGTSNLWHGVLSPLDQIDFEKRSWIPGSGWPISLKDLLPYYKEAAKLLGVKNFEYFELKGLSERLKKNLYNVKFNRKILKNKIFQQPKPEKNFKQDVLELVRESKTQHLYLETTALELIKNNKNKIIKLKVGGKNQGAFEIKANKFVICAGTLETPRLLLNSSINNKNIGKYLMDHPMANLCQLSSVKKQKGHIYSAIKYIPKIAIKTGLVLSSSLQKKLKFPNHAFYIRPTFTKGINFESEKIKLALLTFKDGKFDFKDIWKVLTNINVIIQIALYKFSLNPWFRYSDLLFVTEQIPNKDSTVSLSSVKDKWGYPISKVNWDIKEQDYINMTNWYLLIKDQCFCKDFYSISYEYKLDEWKDNLTSAAHHVGTARMADNESEGVVDKNLKVFGVDNLFVCDGSVFTTAGNVNSGLTISAFGCMLADYLSNSN
jgi:hypothetical protein